MEDAVYALLEAARRARAAVNLEPACGEEELAVFRRRLRGELGEAGAPWYERLLRVSDGLQIDHSSFESAQGLVELNLEWRARDPALARYLVFGHSGNVDLYVYDKERAAEPFCTVNFYRVGEVLEADPTLERLLLRLVRAAGGIGRQGGGVASAGPRLRGKQPRV